MSTRRSRGHSYDGYRYRGSCPARESSGLGVLLRRDFWFESRHLHRHGSLVAQDPEDAPKRAVGWKRVARFVHRRLSGANSEDPRSRGSVGLGCCLCFPCNHDGDMHRSGRSFVVGEVQIVGWASDCRVARRRCLHPLPNGARTRSGNPDMDCSRLLIAREAPRLVGTTSGMNHQG